MTKSKAVVLSKKDDRGINIDTILNNIDNAATKELAGASLKIFERVEKGEIETDEARTLLASLHQAGQMMILDWTRSGKLKKLIPGA